MTTTARIYTTERRKLTAIRAAGLFDGSGWVDDPVVVIDGTQIVSIERASQFQGGEHADVFDLSDTTLLPGLIDTHVHLCFDASRDVVGALAERDDAAVLAAAADAARAAVAGGVTTVRDLGDLGYLSLALRDRHDAGLPTIVTAGPPVTSVGGHCHYLGGEASGEDGIRAAVREHVERGVDVIKIMASGGHLTPGTRTDQAQFTRMELRAAVDEAHRFGLPITAHAHGITAIEDALAVGVDGMEHVTFQRDETVVDATAPLLRAIAASRIAVGLTLGIVPVPGVSPPPLLQAQLPRIMANVGRIVDSGANVVLGTDAGIAPVKPHDVLRHAAQQFAGFGPRPAEVLHTVTAHAAHVIGLAARKGRIAAGYDADILAVDGNPLDDPAALHRIRAVYLRGTRVT